MALSQRTGTILDASFVTYLRMAWCGRTPLAELLQLFHTELAYEGQLSIEHGRHVTRIEEETVSAHPCGIFGVKLQILAVEYVDKVGATHGTSRMSALGFLYH